MIHARNLIVGYGGSPVLEGINLDFAPGKITTIIGANGCGKSTLLRSLAQLLAPTEGSVTLQGTDIQAMKRKELARRIALLPQSPTAPEGITVFDLVARGRYPHQSWFNQWSAADEEQVRKALALTNSERFSDRSLSSLSGGQQQCVWLSMALAQDTDVLLLDEPTTHLDWANALEVLDLVASLNRELGRTVVMVLHDLNLAARYSDHLVVLSQGRVVSTGAPAEVLTPEVLEEAFCLQARVIKDPETGGPLIVPRSR